MVCQRRKVPGTSQDTSTWFLETICPQIMRIITDTDYVLTVHVHPCFPLVLPEGPKIPYPHFREKAANAQKCRIICLKSQNKNRDLQDARGQALCAHAISTYKMHLLYKIQNVQKQYKQKNYAKQKQKRFLGSPSFFLKTLLTGLFSLPLVFYANTNVCTYVWVYPFSYQKCNMLYRVLQLSLFT